MQNFWALVAFGARPQIPQFLFHIFISLSCGGWPNDQNENNMTKKYPSYDPDPIQRIIIPELHKFLCVKVIVIID